MRSPRGPLFGMPAAYDNLNLKERNPLKKFLKKDRHALEKALKKDRNPPEKAV